MSGSDPLRTLRRICASAAEEVQPQHRAGERCELCGTPIADEHNHMVDLEHRTLMCACRGCYLLFTPAGAGGGHFKAVPERFLAFTDLTLTRGEWEALQIPVSVAFFFVNSTLDRVAAFYPGPAGATESLLPLDVWNEIAAEHEELAALAPDVEAILVRSDPARASAEVYLVPIDACYELVGHLRMLWQGFDGGREARDALDAFFASVRERAGVLQ